jgi:hypothetical protein
VFVVAFVSFAATFSAHAAAPGRLEDGILSVEYWPGDEPLARESLAILREALSDFAGTLPSGDHPIEVTICRTLEQFQQRAGQYSRAWVGGISRASGGQIVVKAPYLLGQPVDYEGLLRHELLHVLLARNTNEAYLPRWLNEGIVMVLSKENRWGSMARLARMYASRRLIPYHNLDFAFLPLGDEVLSSDAYAQALGMTRFLIRRLGEKRFWDLIRAMRDEPFEAALLRATGLKPGEFYNAWRDSMWVPAVIVAAGSVFTAFDIMILLVFVAWFRKRRRNLATLEQWKDEEATEGAWQDEFVSPEPWVEEEEE